MITDFGPSEFTETQQATLHEVSARLASGHTLPRVAWLSGVREEHIKRLLAGQQIGRASCRERV